MKVDKEQLDSRTESALQDLLSILRRSWQPPNLAEPGTGTTLRGRNVTALGNLRPRGRRGQQGNNLWKPAVIMDESI